jgi:O-antigen ligase
MYLYLLYFEFDNNDHRSVLWAFVIAVLLATIYALAFPDNKVLLSMVRQNLEVDDGRFRGLYPDPNYYATFAVLAMVSLMCLDWYKHINRIVYYGSFAILIFAGVQTVSKSFILMLLVILVYYGVNMFAQRKYFVGILLLIMIAFFTIWAIEGKIEWLDAVLQRFENAEDMNELTTGRTEIWKRYSDYIFADIGTMLFGEGLNAPLVGSEGTHNIFLESVYYLGIIGLILLISFTIAVIRQIKQKMETNSKAPFLRFLPILAILLMYFFLQGISSILFYLSLFIMYEWYACCISKRPEVA